jgi:hypothetical protein
MAREEPVINIDMNWLLLCCSSSLNQSVTIRGGRTNWYLFLLV